MKKNVAIVVLAVVLLLGATVATVFYSQDRGNNAKGLYALDAAIAYVDAGGTSATPKVVDTIEALYEQVYGEPPHKGYTVDDARADAAFWERYCGYDSIVTVNEDDTFTVRTQSQGYGAKDVTLPRTDRMLSMGTMYMTVAYYLICEKHGVSPYSSGARDNEALLVEFRNVVAGGTDLAYVEQETELLEYIDRGTYRDAGQHTIGNYDRERLADDVSALSADGSAVMLVGTGRTMDKESYDAYDSIVKGQGGIGVLFVTASDIKGSFACIEALGSVLGYGGHTSSLLERLQVKLYSVYKSLEDHAGETHKVYWESSQRNTLGSSGVSKDIMTFFGWDTTLLTQGQVDTEAILREKPDVLIFYNADKRPMDEKMRAA
ncbi:MAG: hypothetical protein LBS92_06720 [Candidatus Methanoplasma sp.]|nr:hypothetical protein [Candidatus Methanoplasma sp.]